MILFIRCRHENFMKNFFDTIKKIETLSRMRKARSLTAATSKILIQWNSFCFVPIFQTISHDFNLFFPSAPSFSVYHRTALTYDFNDSFSWIRNQGDKWGRSGWAKEQAFFTESTMNWQNGSPSILLLFQSFRLKSKTTIYHKLTQMAQRNRKINWN